jgi:hypothetical protein
MVYSFIDNPASEATQELAVREDMRRYGWRQQQDWPR